LLDDLQYFLPQRGELSQAMIARLLDRPGKTVLLATLRTEQRELLRGPDRELTREVRRVFDNADWIELASTREDPREQDRAAVIYPQLRSRPEGLAETLAGAPELLEWYRGAAAVDPPLLHALVQTCVDWARCGLTRPIPEPDLLAVARDTIEIDRPYLNVRDDQMAEALQQAAKPTAGGGQVALLLTQWLHDRSRGYRPFDYLVAADDGEQPGQNARPVTEDTWHSFLHRATDTDAVAMGVAAYQRNNIPFALTASRRAAEADNADGQCNLGILLATGVEPPALAEARTWYTKAAEAGLPEARQTSGYCLPLWWTRRSWPRPAPGTPKLPKPGSPMPRSTSGRCSPSGWTRRGWPRPAPGTPGPPKPGTPSPNMASGGCSPRGWSRRSWPRPGSG
jgi:hypothetical protein